MRKFILCVFSFCSMAVIIQAQTLNVEWQKCLGESGKEERPLGLTRTDQSVTVMFGTTSTTGDFSGNKGETDWYYTKFDSKQVKKYGKIYGGSKIETLSWINENSDQTFTVTGITNSNDGNVNNNHGGNDAWAIKLTENGNIQWRKCIGGTGDDQGYFSAETADKNYLFLGSTTSKDGDFTTNNGGSDIFMIKTDINGIFQFTKLYGGSGNEKPVGMVKLTDGYIILAESNSPSISGAANANKGKTDFLLIKTDLNGNASWAKFFGGPDDDNPAHITLLSDGNLLVTGTTSSTSGDISGAHGGKDIWVAKISSAGTLLWAKNLGGSGNDSGKMAVEYSYTNPVKYFIIGSTASANGGNINGAKGGSDIWVARLSSTGNFENGKNFGGSKDDFAGSISVMTDNSLYITGESNSTDGDVVGNKGGQDVWIAKLAKPTATFDIPQSFDLKVFPNPAATSIHVKWDDQTPVELLDITSITGVSMMQIPVDKSSGFTTIDLGNIPNGHYVLTAIAKDKISRSMIEIVR